MIRHVSMALVLAVLLAACGGQPAAQPTSALVAPTAAPAPTSVPVAATAAPATAVPATSVVSDALTITPAPPPAANAYPRTVTDSLGRAIEFTTRPSRIALDTNRYALDELLLFGIAPIAYQISASEELAPWTEDALRQLGVTLENFNGQQYPTPPNFERLTLLKPDLIIMLDYTNGKNKAEDFEHFKIYEQIAPMFFVEYTDLDASRIRMLAEVFAVEAKVAEIESRDAALFKQVQLPPPGTELAIGFGYKDGGVSSQVYNGGASELVTLERIGFTIKDYGRPEGERMIPHGGTRWMTQSGFSWQRTTERLFFILTQRRKGATFERMYGLLSFFCAPSISSGLAFVLL